jgi:hypothetical protein
MAGMTTAVAMTAALLMRQGDLIRVPQDHRSVQAAIDAAVDGDTVLLAKGLHDGGINFRGKAITVQGEFGAEFTALRGGSPVIRCDSDEGPDTIIRGLTIVGGRGHVDQDGVTRGGGLWLYESSPRIELCLIVGNSAQLAGAVMVTGGTPVFEDCWFHDNPSTSGGSGIVCDRTAPRFVQCGFHEDGVGWIDAGVVDIRTDCDAPGGACCLEGSCVQTTSMACSDAGGFWHDGAACGSGVCPQPCVGDTNADRRVNHTDLFNVLNSWGMCRR